jgi:tRNA-dihydrouridine synthase C
VVKVPVFANGDIWSVEDWRRCREISGVEDIMLGRGLVSRPDLARQIAAARAGEEVVEMSWAELQPMLQDFWMQVVEQLTPRQAPGRLKQWLAMLTRNYPEAVELFSAVRRETDLDAVGRLLGVQRTEAA